jgi:RNA recognition motif-containing protein
MAVKLYVGNLPYTTTEAELADFFGQVGNVTEVQLIHDRSTGRPRGFGFVKMATDTEAQSAIERLHGSPYNGRPLTVNEARPMEQRGMRPVKVA